MFSVRNCCCCINLRTGVIVLTSLNIAFLLHSTFFPSRSVDDGQLPADYQKNIERLQSMSVSPLINFLQLGFNALGLYGAVKNNLSYTRIYAIYNWIALVLSLLFFTFILITFGLLFSALQSACEQAYEGIDDPQARPDCSIISKLLAAMVIFTAVIELITVYLAVCVWSYYQDLKAHPEKYGVVPRVDVNAGPHVTLGDIFARAGHAVYLQTGPKVLGGNLPTYEDAVAPGSGSGSGEDVKLLGGEDK